MQTLLWTPWLLTLALAGAQATAYGWAYLTARHAADQAVQTTRLDGGTADQGRADAQAVLDQAGTGLTATEIQVIRTETTATAVIAVRPVRIIPLAPLRTVHVVATAPVERFQPYTAATS
ncbi:TadE family protein [Phytohabitans houttuyneae]|uniref:Pilus assembly protein TadE n=1 Tax=Phytohabitans houttuyneae TaxID=1076126 RepID=A0A6V8KQY4_9ACTN|nr:TadE family protein [Phytohabitans houttuyneae]GFJ85810.1 hypothetical protein Phou_099900 [Phytohabitans houttuyneae]